jgi:hypothetical protein
MVLHRAETARPVLPSPLSSDNCVKNHFYSKLRKSVRRLNKFITDHLQKEYDQISPRLLSKIIEYSESRFKSSVRVEEETIDYSIRMKLASLDLKNKLYKFENECDEAMESTDDIDIAKRLIDDIFFFEKNNKKPGKLLRKRTNSFDNQKQFLHPKACMRGNRSNSNLSDLSDQSDEQSGCSSSYGESYDEEEVTKPRKRSLTTTRSSKDVSSRNNSQIMEIKLETRSNNADKSEIKEEILDKMVDFDMPIMDLEKLSISLIEDHSFLSMDRSERPSRRASIESRNSKSSDNRSSGSNRRLRTTFDAFCQLDDKIGFNWPNHFNQDPVNEGNEIIWRIIQPKEPTKTDFAIDDDDEPIQPDGMDE